MVYVKHMPESAPAPTPSAIRWTLLVLHDLRQEFDRTERSEHTLTFY